MYSGKFKVGDRIKVSSHSSCRPCVTGVIIKVDMSNGYNYHVKFDSKLKGHMDWCPYYEMELEPLIKVGEQLEFAFMKGV